MELPGHSGNHRNVFYLESFYQEPFYLELLPVFGNLKKRDCALFIYGPTENIFKYRVGFFRSAESYKY